MKLYYSPSACSLSPHIIANELGLAIELIKVDTKTKRTEHGKDYFNINPKGYVPALQLTDGSVLTEGTAIVQYLADLKPDAKLAPANGTMARYRLQEMLGYINSELHKGYTPLFNPKCSAEVRTEQLTYLQKRYGLIETALGKNQFLLGDHFTIADAYLFVVTRWADFIKLDLSNFPNLKSFQTKIATRPSVKTAITREQPSA